MKELIKKYKLLIISVIVLVAGYFGYNVVIGEKVETPTTQAVTPEG